MLRISLLVILIVFAAVSTASLSKVDLLQAQRGNVKYVDPFIGTRKYASWSHAGMIPSVATPFAMTRWTAMTQENFPSKCPYQYDQNTFHGFLATHQPALWMGESGEVVISAGMGSLSDKSINVAFADRGLNFSKADEVSRAHYYKTLVQSPSYSILAELSGMSRASSMRFSFNEDESSTTMNGSPYVALQVTRDSYLGKVTVNPEAREIFGYNPERQDSNLGPSKAEDFKGYFVARFDQNFESFGTALGSTLYPEISSQEGSLLSGYVTFPKGTSSVNVRVGVSYISIEQARENLDRETPNGDTLEDTASKNAMLWNEKLNLVNITNATDDHLHVFYTAMYHALQYPNEMMETNATGTYYYSGFDNKVHKGDYAYTGYSLWDTFRSEWGFINLFAPERVNGMIQSMLQTFQQGGRLPMWQNIVETNIMIGTHASSLIAESLSKGFRGFDLEVAWQALWKDAMVPPENDLTDDYHDREEGTDCEARAGLTRSFDLGYVPAVLTSEAGSRTLEYAYDDYTVAVAANLTGHSEWSQFFLNRSKSYRNIWNDETQFMQAKYENGTWCDLDSTWTEGSKWVYTFCTQHDFSGLRDLIGGHDALNKKLNQMFDLHMYVHTNEPSHAIAFAYLYANNPSETQSQIRRILRNNYFNTPIGMLGSDDCGQMSSWFVFNAMGFYPVNPASGSYLLGTPLFDKMEIQLPQSEFKLEINAGSGATENPYVEAVAVMFGDDDASEVNIYSPELKHSDLMRMKNINFKLNSSPQDLFKDTL